MDYEDWDERWREGRIPFHQHDVTDLLARHGQRVWGVEPLGRVLVPLCGKSLDMVHLADRAASVVGVEYVEQAVQEFFAESASGAPGQRRSAASGIRQSATRCSLPTCST